jgi:ribosomal protein L11 methyltransferase
VENARENAEINQARVEVRLGDVRVVADNDPYDIILANINRNVLLADIPVYASLLNKAGFLVMSGFYTEDLASIRAQASAYGLTYQSMRTKNNWISVVFKNNS